MYKMEQHQQQEQQTQKTTYHQHHVLVLVHIMIWSDHHLRSVVSLHCDSDSHFWFSCVSANYLKGNGMWIVMKKYQHHQEFVKPLDDINALDWIASFCFSVLKPVVAHSGKPIFFSSRFSYFQWKYDF